MIRLFSFVLFAFIFSFSSFSQKETTNVRLNQSGFYPNAPKLAVVAGRVSSVNFYITSVNLRDTFFTGTLSEERQSAYSSTKTRIADFSSFKKEGKYVVASGSGHSYPFEIKNNVEEKNQEVPKMRQYYGNAVVTLIAIQINLNNKSPEGALKIITNSE